MKKIISIDRELTFSTMIKEITSIGLDHTLKFISSNSIEGELIIGGTYKMTEASQLEESFEYKIPLSISTTENYVLDSAEVEIDDFSYEIVDDDILNVKIDILLEGIEEVLVEEETAVRVSEEARECDGDSSEEKVKEIPLKEEQQPVMPTVENIEKEPVKEVSTMKTKIEEQTSQEENIEVLNNQTEETITKKTEETKEKSINSLFMNLKDEDETFSTYLVYIMRKNDSIEKVVEKYGVTREELANYNELDNLEVGDKLIIPCSNE